MNDNKLDNLHTFIKFLIKDEVNKKHKELIEENSNLKTKLAELQVLNNSIQSKLDDELELKNKLNENISLSNNILDSLKYKIMKIVTEQVDAEKLKYCSNRKCYDEYRIGQLLMNFLDSCYQFTFNEKLDRNCPLWLILVVRYYTDKEDIIKLLKYLDVSYPSNINSFRLPIDWTEEELDIFFDNIYNHYNCNNCIYDDNLRFWSPFCLESVKQQCTGNYSEIPWQYVLRNPLILKTKYYDKVLNNFNDCSNWDNFFEIDLHNPLIQEEDIIYIINNIDVDKLLKNKKPKHLINFIVRNVKYINPIKNKKLLDYIYDNMYDKYNFKRDILPQMPFIYVKKFVNNTIKKGHFSYQELLELIALNPFNEQEKQEYVCKILERIKKRKSKGE